MPPICEAVQHPHMRFVPVKDEEQQSMQCLHRTRQGFIEERTASYNRLRAFFAFAPKRRGILLCAGNKTRDEKRFYETMIPIADREFTAHLEKLRKE